MRVDLIKRALSAYYGCSDEPFSLSRLLGQLTSDELAAFDAIECAPEAIGITVDISKRLYALGFVLDSDREFCNYFVREWGTYATRFT